MKFAAFPPTFHGWIRISFEIKVVSLPPELKNAKGVFMEYSIIIKKDPQSGWYIGKCVQIPAAMSQGETLGELMENMKDAITTVLDYYKEEARNSFNNTGIFYRNLSFA